MFVDFFIRRPILASVFAILIVLGGAIAIPALPIARYPTLAAPQVVVTCTYVGASSQTVEAAVTTPLETSINGVEGMRYIQSSSTSDGLSTITVTFEPWRDLDLASVDVQNRVQQALPRLPAEVRATGVTVTKSSTSIVLAVAFYSKHGEYSPVFVSNYVDRYVRDELLRIPGVAEARNFSPRTYAMRIWLDPPRLAARHMTAGDVATALREQNLEIAAGQLGKEPAPEGQALQISVYAPGRLPDPVAFERMVIKTGSDGTLVQLQDVARVELGAEDYGAALRIDGHEAIGVGIFQLPNANALDVVREVAAKLGELSKHFPPGLEYDIGFDPTSAVKTAVREVLGTLGAAIVIVIVVIFLFLQGWRATLIPAITIPVSLVGTFIFVKLFGFSINLLTLFGLTLATGLVVDDAIVVIENIERHLETERRPPAVAASAAMKEVAGVVVATSLVLVAVFVPVSFFPGTTGRIYQQFALTIAFSISLSAFNALTLSPALAARLLRLRTREKKWAPFRAIDRGLGWTHDRYGHALGWCLRHRVIVIGTFVLGLALTGFVYTRVPSAFVPDEDQGYLIIAVQGPSGASLQHTRSVTAQIERILGEQPEVAHVFNVNGFSFVGPGSNRAIVFAGLKPFDQREGDEHSAQAVLGRLRGPLADIGGAIVVPFMPPSIQGVGVFGGFQLEIEDRQAGPPADLAAATFQIVGAASKDPQLRGVLATFTVDDPQLEVAIDRQRAKSLGISLAQIAETLQIELGSLYVNDFDLGDRSYRVYVQADAPFRADPGALRSLYVRSPGGDLIALDVLVRARPSTAPQVLTHFNLFRAAEINGSPAPGTSSGDAMTIMEDLARRTLPAGMTSEWAGLSLEQQRAGHQIALLFALAIVVAYLVLAAQYDSFMLPLIVMLAVPLAILGALVFLAARGLETDVFAQIGMVMLVGLASKNAILIVEFAEQLRAKGQGIGTAAIEAAKIRLRPILMTSLAFVFGVIPLVLASGSGAASRRSLGTTVFGGMIVSSILNLVVIPVLYTVIERARERRRTPGTLGESNEPVA